MTPRRWRVGLSSPGGASLGNLGAQGFAANTWEAAETLCRADEPGELWLQRWGLKEKHSEGNGYFGEYSHFCL